MLILKKDTVFIEPDDNVLIKLNNNLDDLFSKNINKDIIRKFKFVEQYIEEHKEELIKYEYNYIKNQII